MSDREAFNRAELARQVKENPVFREALTAIRAAHIQSMSKVKATDVAKMQEITLSLQNLDRLERRLESFMDTGKLKQKRNIFQTN